MNTLPQETVQHQTSSSKATTKKQQESTTQTMTGNRSSKQRHETEIEKTNRQETGERLSQYIGGKTQVSGLRQSRRQSSG